MGLAVRYLRCEYSHNAYSFPAGTVAGTPAPCGPASPPARPVCASSVPPGWIPRRSVQTMSAMLRTLTVASLTLLAAAPVATQEMKFFYPAPPPSSIEVTKDVPYGSLRMDLYRPAGAATALPVLVFSNIASGAQRSNAFYKSWAEIAASQGLAAVLPDLRAETYAQDMEAVLAHLLTNGSSLRIDRDRIALYAGSGNVFRALPLVQDPKQTAIKSAVMYYGAAPVTEFRRDLPVLFVRAGLDRPPVNRAMTDLVTAATSQNAPVSLLNYPAGHHAFEIVDD